MLVLLVLLSFLYSFFATKANSPPKSKIEEQQPDPITSHTNNLARSGCTSLPAPTGKSRELDASQMSWFGVNLYKELIKETEKSLMISPYSLYLALSLVTLGARGNTEVELLSALCPGETAKREEFHHALHLLDQKVQNSLNSNQKVSLQVANAAWADTSLSLHSCFKSDIQTLYQSEIHSLPICNAPEQSRLKINKWVEDQTNHKIKDLIPRLSTLTRLVITNAVYFLGEWKYGFKKQQTSDRRFRLLTGEYVEVPTMKATVGKDWKDQTTGEGPLVPYAYVDKVTVLELPYQGNGNAVMTFFMPDEDHFLQFESSLSFDTLATLVSSLRPTQVDTVALPRFSLATPTLSLKSYLQKLGIHEAFDGANFEGISREVLEIAEVYHKTFISVDEKGTEAAAATAIGVIGKSLAISNLQVLFDKPFMYAVRDTSTGAFLFLGRVLDPRS